MRAFRVILKINLALALVLFWLIVAYRHAHGLPLVDLLPGSHRGPLGTMLVQALAHVISLYILFVKHVSEALVRVCGIVGGILWITGVAMSALGPQHWNSFACYAWASVAACALVGKRPLTKLEMDELVSVLSRRVGSRR